mmetsp:Transcript_89729/g.262329  ORF Transcript_89729/g.262329 Transcript_89729/m.262329 type:complete len:124 (+) Transcript_89729:62-433(+)
MDSYLLQQDAGAARPTLLTSRPPAAGLPAKPPAELQALEELPPAGGPAAGEAEDGRLMESEISRAVLEATAAVRDHQRTGGNDPRPLDCLVCGPWDCLWTTQVAGLALGSQSYERLEILLEEV